MFVAALHSKAHATPESRETYNKQFDKDAPDSENKRYQRDKKSEEELMKTLCHYAEGDEEMVEEGDRFHELMQGALDEYAGMKTKAKAHAMANAGKALAVRPSPILRSPQK
jgi:hypothetical protein